MSNQWVVPYNPYLCRKYNAHINVELCSSVKSVKYLYKYVYKGNDCANVKLTLHVSSSNTATTTTSTTHTNSATTVAPPVLNEIIQHLNTRYVSAPESVWRLMEFKLFDSTCTVYRLAIHLDLEQVVYFQPGQEQQAVDKAEPKLSHLTAWFELNRNDKNARQHLYHQVPNYYKFKDNIWSKRKRGHDSSVIGRIYNVSISEGDKYYLRVLLLHVRGATSYAHLRTVNGIQHETFKQAAQALGLLRDDKDLFAAMEEASHLKMPSELRLLFASICLWSCPTEPMLIFTKFLDDLIEDYVHQNISRADATNQCLLHLRSVFVQHGKFCWQFGLPEPSTQSVQQEVPACNLEQERVLADEYSSKLNPQQRLVVERVLESVCKVSRQNCFFIDGPGGTGKTFCYSAITHRLRALGKKVISVAWTGIAATLLIEGRTVHNIFQIPLNINESSTSSMKMNSKKATDLKEADLIVWDEAPMAPLHALNAINRLLQKLMGNELPFGGKTIVLGGDFRQVNYVSKLLLSLKSPFFLQIYYKQGHSCRSTWHKNSYT